MHADLVMLSVLLSAGSKTRARRANLASFLGASR
jgi:hypothetical protein